MAVDVLLSCSGAWITAARIFPFGVSCISIEELLWVLFLVFYTIVFYEHFCDDENIFRLSKKLKYFIPISVSLFLLILLLALSSYDLGSISYAYFKVGVIGVVPIILYLALARRNLLKKLIPVIVYFFFFDLIMEISAVRNNGWSFPDIENYIGTITVFGAMFPLEELVFWMILSPAFLLTYYEIYVDDNA